MAALPLPQQLLTLFPAAAAVLILLLASAPAARARSSSSTSATYRCGWCPRRSTASLLPPDAGAITGAACGYGGQVPEMAIDGGFHMAIDVDFRRIPCVYRSKNLAVKVEETSSRERGHLALRFLYQGGQTDMAAVEVAQAVTGSSGTNNDAAPLQTSWQYMTRREVSPSVWRTSRVPAGPLRLRLVVTAGSGGKWLRTDGAVLPAEWQPGAVYDTGLRVTDVAANTCGGASCSATDEGDDDEQLR